MADIVKEIYNGTILFGNYTDSLQTLATTGANTTLVVKDVEIGTNGYTTAPNLQVSGFNVGSLSGNLSGSEIIGTNSALQIKNNDTTSLFTASVTYINNLSVGSPPYYAATNPSVGIFPTTPTTTVAQGTGSAISPNPTGGGQISFAHYVNGKFIYYYFDGNSTTQSYYRTGLTGSDTQFGSGSYAPTAYDGNGKMYWWYGSLYEYDTATNAVTNLGNPMGWPYGSTYPLMAARNGVVFYQSSDGSAVYWYNRANGQYGNMNGWSHSNYVCNPTVFYDPTTYTYRIVTQSQVGGFNSGFYYYDIQSNAEGTSFTYVSLGSGLYPSLAGYGNPSIRIGHPTTSNGLYSVCFGHGGNTTTVYRIDKNLVMTPIETVTGASFGQYTSGTLSLSAATQEQLNTYGPQISLRITGVESTI